MSGPRCPAWLLRCGAPGPYHGYTQQAYYCERPNGHSGDHAAGNVVRTSPRWPQRSDFKPRICKCHSSDLYSSLTFCPRCGHHSFDTTAEACERRACGYIRQAS